MYGIYGWRGFENKCNYLFNVNGGGNYKYGIKLDEINLFLCLFEWKFIIGMKEVKEKWCEIGNIWIE